MNEVRWADIETECGDYRAGFIAVYDKYRGRTTDEVDDRGRKVKVTASSFARHLGIPARTFREWVKLDGGRRRPDRDRTRETIKRMTPTQKAELAKSIVDDIEDEDVVTDVASAAFERGDEIRRDGKPKATPRHRRKGAIDGWSAVIGRSHAADFQAKKCLDEIKSLDQPMPDDLTDDVLQNVDVVIGRWQMVRAVLRGETVGDQAEDFLAGLTADDE